MEYLQSPDLWHMVEAGERDACDVVVIEGTAKKGKQTQMDWISSSIFDRTIYGIKYNLQQQQEKNVNNMNVIRKAFLL